MPITIATANAVTTTVKARFNETLMSSDQAHLERFAMLLPSDTKTAEAVWYGAIPLLKEVTHTSVQYEDLTEFSQSLEIQEWSAGMKVPWLDMTTDRLNLIRPKIDQLALRAARHKGRQIGLMYEQNPTAFDGAAWFANTRSFDQSGNIDNLLAGTGTTTAQVKDDIQTLVRGFFAGVNDDKGENMGLLENGRISFVIPPNIEEAFFQALNPNRDTDAPAGSVVPQGETGNGMISRSGYDVHINYQLTDTNDWYAHVEMDGLGPMFLHELGGPQVLASDDPTDRKNMEERASAYTVLSRFRIAPADPRFSCKVVNS